MSLKREVNRFTKPEMATNSHKSCCFHKKWYNSPKTEQNIEVMR